ncbi:hypothetical protein [Roseimicrobium gellanilyticum]|nr:hypothetical protein [Roseimicrobium gellanilyticum]
MKTLSWLGACRLGVSRWVAMGSVGCLLIGMHQIKAQDANAEVQAAFRKLAEASNHSFQWRTETVPGTPQSALDIRGKAERDGWAFLTQASSNSTYEIVFKKRKGLIKLPEGWKSVGDLLHPQGEEEARGQGPRPMRRDLMLLTGGKLPIHMAGDISGRITAFKKEGDFYTCELAPVEAAKALGVEKRKGVTIPAKLLVRVQVVEGVPVLFEMQQRFEEGGRTQGFNVTATFSDIGKAEVEVPEMARRRMEQPPKTPATAPQPAGANLSREEALEVAKKVQGQFMLINATLLVYAMGNDGRYPEGKTSNEVFRELFQSGLCEDEMLFAIPDTRARNTGKLPDGQVGTVDDGFSKALVPGECDVTLVTPPPTGTPSSRNRPILRADIKASDGTVVTVFTVTTGRPYVVETRDGILYDEPPNDKVDLFSTAAGVEPAHILKPAPAATP